MNLYLTFYEVFSELGFGQTMFGQSVIDLLSLLCSLFIVSVPFIVVIWILKMCCGKVN